MAEQLQGSPESSQPSSGWSHDWHPLDNYYDLHFGHMNRLENSGTVISHSLTVTEVDGENGEVAAVHIEGRINCAKEVAFHVDKWLEVRRGRQDRLEARGISYSYHAWVQSTGNDLLRYDSAHGMDGLHRHFFDRSGQEVEIRPVALPDLPTLAQVIEEAVALA